MNDKMKAEDQLAVLLSKVSVQALLFVANDEINIKKMVSSELADRGWSVSNACFVGEKAALEELFEEWSGK